MVNTTAQFMAPEAILAAGGVTALPHFVMATVYLFFSTLAGRFTLRKIQQPSARKVILVALGVIFAAGLSHGLLVIMHRLQLDLSAWQLRWSLIPTGIATAAIGWVLLNHVRGRQAYASHPQSDLQTQFEIYPTGLVAVDHSFRIQAINSAAATLFEYLPEELLGRPLNILLAQELHSAHTAHMQRYWANPEQNHAMSDRRFVEGITRNGRPVNIEVRLFFKTINNRTYTLASLNNVAEAEHQKNRAVAKAQQLRRAMDASSDGFWEWNPHTGGVWFNKAFIRMTHHQAFEQPSWEQWRAHIHPDDQAAIKASFDQELNQQGHFDVCYRGLTAAGGWEWMRLKGAQTRDEKGHTRISGTLINIHQSKLQELAHQERQRFLADLLAKTASALALYHLGGRTFRFFNEAFCNLTGYTQEELMHMADAHALLELYHPDDRAQVSARWSTMAEGNDALETSLSCRLRHKNGDYIWCKQQAQVFSRHDDDSPNELLFNLLDISAEISAIEGAKEEASALALMLSGTPIGLAQVSLSGHLQLLNPALANMLGFRAEDLLGKHLESLVAPSHKDMCREQAATLKQGPLSSSRFNLALQRSNGAIRWVQLTLTKVPSEAPQYFVASIEDYSEQQSLKQQIQEADQAMERFTHAASHDLQEPLRKISAFVNALERRLKQQLHDKDALYELDRVGDAAKRMTEMMQRLLTISRLSKIKLNKQKYSFNNVLKLACQALQGPLAQTQGEITEPEDFDIFVDQDAMAQALQNILDNSLRYTNKGTPPQIHFSHRLQGGRHLIEIRDNGPGIKPEQAELVFEPFTRFVDKSNPGCGLGLTYCKQFAKVHDGAIYVASPHSAATSNTHPAPPSGLTLVLELPEDAQNARE